MLLCRVDCHSSSFARPGAKSNENEPTSVSQGLRSWLAFDIGSREGGCTTKLLRFLGGCSNSLLLALLRSGNNVVDAKDHACALDGRHDRLPLYAEGLPNSQLIHVDQVPRLAVDAPVARLTCLPAGGALVVVGRVLGAEPPDFGP